MLFRRIVTVHSENNEKYIVGVFQFWMMEGIQRVKFSLRHIMEPKPVEKRWNLVAEE